MKTIIYIFTIFIPVVVCAQQNWLKSSPLNNWEIVGIAGFSAGNADYISLAISPSEDQPYVAYDDGGNSWKTSVMKFDGTKWVNVGLAGFSAGEASYTCLAFSPSDGQPYVAFSPQGNFRKATVMKFDGTTWVNVGVAGFSAAQADWLSFAFNPSGQPYVSFSDFGTNPYNKATVMKFDGSNWVNVGTAGFSAGKVDMTSLAFSPFDDQPYVAYTDYPNSQKATVMKFDGTNWVNVGNAGFSAGSAGFISLAISPTDSLPYVAYQDDSEISRGATVMKFNGNSWVYVGAACLSAGTAEWTNITFSPSGHPIVAYVDYANSQKATVMEFDGTNWVNVGTAGFSAGVAFYPDLAFSQIGQLFIAFMDYANSQKATVMKYDSVYNGIKNPIESILSLYPNPATTNLIIDFKNINSNLKVIEVFELRGKKIFETQTNKDGIILNVENYADGIYLVKIKTNNSSHISKFFKN